MGIRSLSRFFGLVSILSLIFSTTALAANKYVVVLKSPTSYRMAKQSSQRSGEFLGTRAVTEKFLDHLNMVIVQAEDDQVVSLQRNANVELVEKDFIIPAPKFRLAPAVDRANYIPPKNAELTWGIKAVKADKAWAITKGANARVMDLDSGIDENHIDLINRIEKTKVLTGSSIVDEIGHGTHTAGTILADGAGSGLLGVAPEARLLVGKVCGGFGCNSTAILQGIDWAIAEKVDVVNMSLGGPFTSSSAGKAYAAAEAAGVMVVAASGNSGSASVSYPAAYESVLAVGALMPDLTKASFSQWGPQLDVMAPGVDVYSTVPSGTGREGQITVNGQILPSVLFVNSQPALGMINGQFAFGGLGKATDIQGKDFTGTIALIQRGEITFAEKVKNAMAAGAKAVVIFNNVPGLFQGGLEQAVKIPVLMIEQSAGEAILASLNQGQTVAADVGTVITDYASQHGTSMACPHVTGVAALVRSVNKNLTPAQVRELIKSTATALTPNTNNEMGSGLVDAEKAVMQAQSM